jgi:hypothetical protein
MVMVPALISDFLVGSRYAIVGSTPAKRTLLVSLAFSLDRPEPLLLGSEPPGVLDVLSIGGGDERCYSEIETDLLVGAGPRVGTFDFTKNGGFPSAPPLSDHKSFRSAPQGSVAATLSYLNVSNTHEVKTTILGYLPTIEVGPLHRIPAISALVTRVTRLLPAPIPSKKPLEGPIKTPEGAARSPYPEPLQTRFIPPGKVMLLLVK